MAWKFTFGIERQKVAPNLYQPPYKQMQDELKTLYKVQRSLRSSSTQGVTTKLPAAVSRRSLHTIFLQTIYNRLTTS